MTLLKMGAGLALVILVSCADPDGATGSKSHQEAALLGKRGSTEARKLSAGGTFDKSSTEAEVLKVMGTPDDIRGSDGSTYDREQLFDSSYQYKGSDGTTYRKEQTLGGGYKYTRR